MSLRPTAWRLAAASLVLAAVACQDTDVVEPIVAPPSFSQAEGGATAAAISAQMDAANLALEATGSDIRVMMAEYIGGGDEAGAQVLQRDVGNKRLGADFVPNDPRRTWSGAPGGTSDDITYAVDQVDAVPLSPNVTAAETNAAIDAAMGTWDAQVCSDLGIRRNPDVASDLGFIAASNGLGGSFDVQGDVQHAGFSDIDFAGGVLGVAFTLIFTDGDGNPTDIDGNGLADVAFREIYYDPSWLWTVGNFPGVDVESIALHETGHGLSQAHFGNIFNKKGVFTANPRAVMNAFYQGELRGLLGTDNGGHCSNWAQWPQN